MSAKTPGQAAFETWVNGPHDETLWDRIGEAAIKASSLREAVADLAIERHVLRAQVQRCDELIGELQSGDDYPAAHKLEKALSGR